jgi:hypothetical protein
MVKQIEIRNHECVLRVVFDVILTVHLSCLFSMKRTFVTKMTQKISKGAADQEGVTEHDFRFHRISIDRLLKLFGL